MFRKPTERHLNQVKLTMNEIEDFNKELIALKEKLNYLKVSVFEENQSRGTLTEAYA